MRPGRPEDDSKTKYRRRSGVGLDWQRAVAVVAVLAAVLSAVHSWHAGAAGAVSCAAPSAGAPKTTIVERMRAGACPQIPIARPGAVAWNDSRFMVVTSQTSPSFYISLHPRDIDEHRWSIFRSGAYYERALTAAAEQFLQNDTRPGVVVDVGASVGWLSLYAAALGHQVVTFEPNPKNVLRLCESIALNEFHSRIDLNLKAVSNLPSMGELAWGKNPGGGSIRGSKRGKGLRTHIIPTRITTLDEYFKASGWRDVLLLKLDIEGYEPLALQGARQLMRRCNVFVVYTELSSVLGEKAVVQHALNEMVEAGYQLRGIDSLRDPVRVQYVLQQFQQKRDGLLLIAFCKMDARNYCNLVWVKEDQATKCG